MTTVVLDAGHGGYDSGAIGTRGLKESDVALDIVLRAKRKIECQAEQPINVLLTRGSDFFVSLSGRAKFANDRDADFFLSVHCNSADSPEAEGFEVFTTIGETAADNLATDLFSRYKEVFPDLRRREDFSDGDPDKEAKFTVLTKTACPAVLLETEFIHTEKGSNFFRNDENLDRIAQVIADWVIAHA